MKKSFFKNGCAKFVDETLSCDHPIETAPAVLLRSNNDLVCSSNFLVCVNDSLWSDRLKETSLADVYLNFGIFKGFFSL